MISLIIIILFIMIAIGLYRNKIHINLKSFIKKGFTKENDKYGVYCFCGKQGTGKTYSVVDFLNQKNTKGMKIITNVKSYYDRNKENCIYMTNISEIIQKCENEEFRNKYVIFYDEIFTLLERQSKMNKEILAFLSQMRKRGIYFLTTAQEWLEINMTFRRYCRFQIECNMINFPIFNIAICINKIYDATQMKWSSDDNEYIAPIIQTNIKKGNLEVIQKYDTYETIETSK